jgi:hypothetical protein
VSGHEQKWGTGPSSSCISKANLHGFLMFYCCLFEKQIMERYCLHFLVLEFSPHRKVLITGISFQRDCELNLTVPTYLHWHAIKRPGHNEFIKQPQIGFMTIKSSEFLGSLVKSSLHWIPVLLWNIFFSQPPLQLNIDQNSFPQWSQSDIFYWLVNWNRKHLDV